jgi:hypothetical protein
MTTIDPTSGAPLQRPSADRPKTAGSPAQEKFTVPGAGASDTVAARSNTLSFGSLGPLVNSNLSTEAALDTAKRLEALLTDTELPVLNNSPQAVAGLFEEVPGSKR